MMHRRKFIKISVILSFFPYLYSVSYAEDILINQNDNLKGFIEVDGWIIDSADKEELSFYRNQIHKYNILKSQYNDLENQYAILTSKYKESQKELKSIYNSRLWRYIKFLRK